MLSMLWMEQHFFAEFFICEQIKNLCKVIENLSHTTDLIIRFNILQNIFVKWIIFTRFFTNIHFFFKISMSL